MYFIEKLTQLFETTEPIKDSALFFSPKYCVVLLEQLHRNEKPT